MHDRDSRETGDTSNALLSAALGYAANGRQVIPLHSWTGRCCSCGHADCSSPAKHPLTRNGLKDATTDETIIRRWWARWPDANIGILTGAASGIFVLDVDPRHRGDESLPKLIKKYGPFSPTLVSITGGGGRHFVFRHPGKGARIPNAANLAGFPGLDIRGDGGYIVAPPSIHKSGHPYAWKEREHD